MVVVVVNEMLGDKHVDVLLLWCVWGGLSAKWLVV